jgi:hypothetical protein
MVRAVALVSLVLASSAAASPPRAGIVVPGKRFDGLRLGATTKQVRAAWGNRFGRCRDCRLPTWYFNYRQSEPQGVGVSFRNGRAVALFTMWSPPGWRTDRGLRIGDASARITALYGPLLRTNCGTYSAFTLRRGRAKTSFYVFDDQVWGFGLSRLSEPTCR